MADLMLVGSLGMVLTHEMERISSDKILFYPTKYKTKPDHRMTQVNGTNIWGFI